MKTLKINYLISGTIITIPFNATCSITDKRFEGNVIIEYHPKKRAVEYIDVEAVIRKILRKKLTVEELAHETFEATEAAITPKYLKVLVDVNKSDAHQPVQVWIERMFQ